jgi:hypothetical protein
VILCWLALLLIRIAETKAGDTWRNLRDQLERVHLGTSPAPWAPANSAPNSPPASTTSSPRSASTNHPSSSTSTHRYTPNTRSAKQTACAPTGFGTYHVKRTAESRLRAVTKSEVGALRVWVISLAGLGFWTSLTRLAIAGTTG